MRIAIGVQFFLVKVLVYKGFSILFNDNRLYGDFETVAVGAFAFYPFLPFNERSAGCAF